MKKFVLEEYSFFFFPPETIIEAAGMDVKVIEETPRCLLE